MTDTNRNEMNPDQHERTKNEKQRQKTKTERLYLVSDRRGILGTITSRKKKNRMGWRKRLK